MRYGFCKKSGRGCEAGHLYACVKGGILWDVYEAMKINGRLCVKLVTVGRFGDGEIGEYFGTLNDMGGVA